MGTTEDGVIGVPAEVAGARAHTVDADAALPPPPVALPAAPAELLSAAQDDAGGSGGTKLRNSALALRASGRLSDGRRSMRGVNNALATDEEDKNFGVLLGQSNSERKDGGNEPLLCSVLLAEFVGTFFLVFTVGVSTQSTLPILAPIAIGLMLSIMIYNFGSVSGAMFNPAVTVAVVASGRDKLKLGKALPIIGVQFFAGLMGGMIALCVTDKTFCFDYEANGDRGGSGTSFLLEVIYTAGLCSTVLHTGTSLDVPNHYFGFAIGLTVTASAYACSGFDQGSFNPAVTLGINIANSIHGDKGQKECGAGDWLLFLFVPFIGSGLSAAVFRGTRSNEYLGIGDAAIGSFLLREKLLAEFFGTFYLVFTVGVAVVGQSPFAPIAIGMMLAVKIYTYGAVSGACLNPAVTVAVALSGRGKIQHIECLYYIGTQLIAGVSAGLVAYIATGKTFYFDYEITKAGGAGSSVILEAFCTAALCITVLVTATSRDAPNNYFGFAIGLTVTASAILCGDFDQGCLNPAVLVGINFAHLFDDSNHNASAGAVALFFLTPFLGSVIAALIFFVSRVKEYENHRGNIVVAQSVLKNKDPALLGAPLDKE